MIELKITMLPGGGIEVNGPIANTGQCYMLLELAKDVIREYAATAAKSAIVPANGSELRTLKLQP